MTKKINNLSGTTKRLLALLLAFALATGFAPVPAFAQGSGSSGVTDSAPGASDMPIGMSGLMRAALAPVGLSEVDAYWPSFRGNDTNMAITNVLLPIDNTKINLKWNRLYGPEWSDYKKAPSIQIIVDDALVFISENTLIKLDLETGETIATGEMASVPSYGNIAPLYAAGMIFCSLDGGIVQAFDAETLKSLWVYTDPLGGQAQVQMAYSDGYLYSGFWISETDNANFVALPITDEDPTLSNEAKLARWVFNGVGGFYWTGGVVVGDAIVFGRDDGLNNANTGANGPSEIYSLNKYTGVIISALDIVGDQRSSISYDRESGKVFFTTKAGYLYSADIDVGSGELSGLIGVNQNLYTTSTPLVYGGRVYIGGGAKNWREKSYFIVADSDTLEQLYKIEMKGYPQCSMLMTTAYEETSGYIYLYSTYNSRPGGISMIKVKPDAKTAEEAELIELYNAAGVEEFCITSLICGPDGTIYYKNDSRNVLAVGVPLATGVVNLIATIGTVTLDSADVIVIARNAYDALPDADKAAVTNYALLTTAEATLTQLMRQKKADRVKALIDDIGTVNKNSGSKIRAVRSAYNALTAEEKALVTNYFTLTAAEHRYDRFPSQSVSDKPSASKPSTSALLPSAAPESLAVMNRIISLPSTGAYGTAQIIEIYKLYAQLTDVQKAEILNFEALKAQMTAIGNQNKMDSLSGMRVEGTDWNIKLNVQPTTSADERYSVLTQALGSNTLLMAWDISLSDILTNGQYIPNGELTLRMPAPELDSYDDIMIAHYPDDGTVEYIACEAVDGELTWQVTSFSYYAVVRMAKEAAAPLPQTEELPLPSTMQPPVQSAPPTAQAPALPWLWILVAGAGVAAVAVALLAMKGKIFAKPTSTDERH